MPVDFASQDYLRDPAAAIAALRAAGPVVAVRFPIVGEAFVTTTEAAASRVLKDGATFTLRRDGKTAGTRWWMPRVFRALSSNLLTTDGPEHTRLRGIVEAAFQRRAILDMEPRVMAIAETLAAALFAAGTPADLVERYARPLPLAVICELLGLPAADRPRFMNWADRIAGTGSGPLFVWRVYRAITSIRRYLERRLDDARRHGGEGLIAELVRAEAAGAPISRDELIAMVFLLLFAGSETVTHLISGAVYEVLRQPSLRASLVDDQGMSLAVEEFLRVVSPVLFAKPRFVRHAVVIDGVTLPRGAMVMPLLAAANCDPAANPAPERLDLQRRPNRHMSFGSGAHFCLGHQLARIEARCALSALFRRWPDLAMAAATSTVRWRAQPNLRAIEALVVTTA